MYYEQYWQRRLLLQARQSNKPFMNIKEDSIELFTAHCISATSLWQRTNLIVLN